MSCSLHHSHSFLSFLLHAALQFCSALNFMTARTCCLMQHFSLAYDARCYHVWRALFSRPGADSGLTSLCAARDVVWWLERNSSCFMSCDVTLEETRDWRWKAERRTRDMHESAELSSSFSLNIEWHTFGKVSRQAGTDIRWREDLSFMGSLQLNFFYVTMPDTTQVLL